jgi:hypothetical protein
MQIGIGSAWPDEAYPSKSFKNKNEDAITGLKMMGLSVKCEFQASIQKTDDFIARVGVVRMDFARVCFPRGWYETFM